MSSKRDWGGVVAGGMFLLVGVIFLWQGRLGLLYHTPIYFKGPSWLNPWQAIIGGALFSALGLFAIVSAIRRRKPGGDR
jgi:putative Mn2+ efflux pump MntP